MFRDCYNLCNVNLSEGIEVINNNTFACAGPAELVLPSSVKSVFNGAFYDSKIEHLIIKSNHINFNMHGLNGMHNLKRITANKEVVDLILSGKMCNSFVEYYYIN